MAKDLEEIIALQLSELQRLATAISRAQDEDCAPYIKELKAWFMHPNAAQVMANQNFAPIIKNAWQHSSRFFGSIMLAALLEDPLACKQVVNIVGDSHEFAVTINHIMEQSPGEAQKVYNSNANLPAHQPQTLLNLKQNILNTTNILSIVTLVLMTNYRAEVLYYSRTFDLLFAEINKNNSKLTLNLIINGQNLFSLLLSIKSFQAAEFLLRTHAQEVFPQTEAVFNYINNAEQHHIYNSDFNTIMRAIVAILDLAGKYELKSGDFFSCTQLREIKESNQKLFYSIAYVMESLPQEKEISHNIIIETLLSNCPELQRLMSHTFSPNHPHRYPGQEDAFKQALVLALDLYRVNKLPKVIADEHNRVLHDIAHLMNQAYRQNFGHITTKVMLAQPAALQDGIATITTALKNMLKSKELTIEQLNSAENRKLLCNKVAQFAHNTGNLNVINVQNLIKEFTKDIKKSYCHPNQFP